jgi:hypothetical protein
MGHLQILMDFILLKSLGATLVFTYVGMMEAKILVSQTTHNVVMETSTTGLDEVIVVGYGTQKKREITGASSLCKIR